MTDTDKNTGSSESKVLTLTPEQKQLNMKINYYIMRYMWRVIRGRKSEETIHDFLDTSRDRYTRIINTGKARISKEEKAKWHKRTGLPETVFSGDIRIECAKYEKQDGQSIPRTITTEEWKKLFSLREKRREAHENIGDNSDKQYKAAYEKSKKKYTQVEKTIQDILVGATRRDSNYLEFFQLCYWLKHVEPAPAKFPDEDVKPIIEALSLLTFRKLDECELDLLEPLYKELSQKAKLAKTVFEYKSAQQKQKI